MCQQYNCWLVYNNVEIEWIRPYVHILQADKPYFLYTCGLIGISPIWVCKKKCCWIYFLDVELTRDCVKVPSEICRTNIIFFQLFVNFILAQYLIFLYRIFFLTFLRLYRGIKINFRFEIFLTVGLVA